MNSTKETTQTTKYHRWLDMFEMQDLNQLSYAILMQILAKYIQTPWKLNAMEPKNHLSFGVSAVKVSGGV